MKKDKIVNKVVKALEGRKKGKRFSLAMDILFHAALYGGYNHCESIGMLELTKDELNKTHNEVVCNECREKELD